MQFVNGTPFEELYLEDTHSGFLKRYRNADYFLFEERREGWVAIDQAIAAFAEKRIRGLRKQTEFKLAFGLDDRIGCQDRIPVEGELSIEYKTTNPRKLITYSNLPDKIEGSIKNVLRKLIQKIPAEKVFYETDDIQEQSNRRLATITSGYGFTIKITDLTCQSSIDTTIIDALNRQVTLQYNMPLDIIEEQHKIVLEDMREEAQLKRDVARAFQLGSVDVQLGRMLADNTIHLMDQLASTGVEPIAALMAVFPEAGEAISSYIDNNLNYMLEVARTDTLRGYLNARSGGTQAVQSLPSSQTTFSTPALLNSGTSSALTDPLARQLSNRYPDAHISCRSMSDEKIYTVQFSNCCIEFTVDNWEAIKHPMSGTSNPNYDWTGDMPSSKGSSFERSCQLIDAIQRSFSQPA